MTTPAFTPIAKRMMAWGVGDSKAVGMALAQRHERDLTDAEREAVKRWLPQMRHLTSEASCAYYRTRPRPWHEETPVEAYDYEKQCQVAALAEIDEIEEAMRDSRDEARNLRLSRAIDSDYYPPVPPGQELYPFQRAGVEFALRVLGVLK